MADVLQEVKHSPHVKQLFANSQFYTKEEDEAILFTGDLWDNVATKLSSSIVKYTMLCIIMFLFHPSFCSWSLFSIKRSVNRSH